LPAGTQWRRVNFRKGENHARKCAAGDARQVSLIGDVAAILRLAALGFDAVGNTPDPFAAYVKAEVIKDSGTRVD